MTKLLVPLDPDIRDLLAAEKAVVELDPSHKEALFATAMASVGVGAPGSGAMPNEPSGTSASATGRGTTPASPPPIDAASAVQTTGSIATSGLSATRAVVAILTTFALGVGAGVALERHVLAPPPSSTAPSPSPRVVPTASASASVPETSDAPLDRPGVQVSSLPEASVTPPADVSVAKNDGAVSARGLAAERALLDVARRSLASGDPNAALAASDRHAKQYPAGALVEEREAIAIKSLVALGRSDEAKARAGAFERRFPSSLLLRAVRAAAFGAP